MSSLIEPVLRNMDLSCITIVNRASAPDIIPAASACHRLTVSASAVKAYRVDYLLDENPKRCRILRTLHRQYLTRILPRIQFRSFLGVDMFLPASLSANLLIHPNLARETLSPPESVTEAT